VTVLLLLKLLTSLSHGWQALFAEIPLWQEDFLSSFFTIEYMAVLSICFVTWLISAGYAELLGEMGLERALLERDHGVFMSDHEKPPRERLQGMVITIGAFLVVLTALSRIDVRAFFSQQSGGDYFSALPWLAGGGLPTLLYFVLGFTLLSLAKFIDLYTRWSLQGISVGQDMAGRWARYSLILVAALAAMVSLLPTHYSLGLIALLNQLVGLILTFLTFVAGLIYLLLLYLMYPFGALLALFDVSLPDDMPTPTPVEPTFTEPPLATPLPFWEMIKPFLFWGLFLIVVGYALRYYLLQHEALLHTLQKTPVSRWLRQLWHWLASIFRNMNQQIACIVAEGKERMRSTATKPLLDRQGRLLSLGRLNPRQQVHFYYHALIRRGNESRLPRKGSQTPSEYAAMLEQNLPEVNQEIDIMTKSFVKARYTQQDIGKGDVRLVRKQWERVRKALRFRRTAKE